MLYYHTHYPLPRLKDQVLILIQVDIPVQQIPVIYHDIDLLLSQQPHRHLELQVQRASQPVHACDLLPHQRLLQRVSYLLHELTQVVLLNRLCAERKHRQVYWLLRLAVSLHRVHDCQVQPVPENPYACPQKLSNHFLVLLAVLAEQLGILHDNDVLQLVYRPLLLDVVQQQLHHSQLVLRLRDLRVKILYVVVELLLVEPYAHVGDILDLYGIVYDLLEAGEDLPHHVVLERDAKLVVGLQEEHIGLADLWQNFVHQGFHVAIVR